jgi:Zn-dependent protease
MGSDFLAMALIWYVAFLFSTVCHEAAHALVAKWGGDLTAYSGGHVTLDPIPHIKREPFGLVVIPWLCLFLTNGASMFGWGSAPFDPYWQIRYPKRAALMALAGPVSNFLIAIAAAVVMHAGISYGIFTPGFPVVSATGNSFVDGAAMLLSVLFILNVILGVFNLLPIPPLDGYSVLGLFMPEQAYLNLLNFSRSSGFSGFGIILAYLIFPRVVEPVLYWAKYVFLLPLFR